MEANILPEDFYSDQPPERIIGTECEYTIQQHATGKDALAIESYISPAAIQAAGYAHLDEYLSNGSRLYADSEVLEYATPECLGPRQAAAADLAGITVVRNIVGKSGELHLGVYRNAGSDIRSKVERMAHDDKKTTGYHENYMMPRAMVDDTFRAIVPAHVASRTWAMGGLLEASGFKFSQKISGIGGQAISVGASNFRTCEGQKPMIMIPNAADDDELFAVHTWQRVEIRHADPGMSPTMRYVSLAATSLVLRLVEQADKLGMSERLQALRLRDPIAAARQFTDTLSLKKCVPTITDKFVSALDVSEQLAQYADELSQKVALPPDEVAAIPLWFNILDAMRSTQPSKGEYGEFVKVSDFAAKHHRLLARSPGQKLTSLSAKQATNASNWDRIDASGAGVKWWGYFESPHVPLSLIERYVDTPPPTRAQDRVKTILQNDGSIASVDWATAYDEDGVRYALSNPYGEY